MKRICRKKSGETLIESIVTFAVLLLIAAVGTGAALGSIRLSKHAIAVSRLLEEACTAAEMDTGEETSRAKMALSFADPSAPEGFKTIPEIDISIKRAGGDEGVLWYFTPVSGGGGNG